MYQSQSLQRVLASAREREKKYDWLKAAELYEQALGAVGKKDFLEKGKIQEKIGYAFYRAAMQAESVDEFRERMRQAAANYEKAMEFYGRLSERSRLPWMLRCDALITYMGYWLNSDVPEKKRLLDECWRLTKEALKAFEEARECLEYGKTYNQLSSCALLAFFLEWDSQARKKRIKEALEHGEQAIDFYSDLGNHYELTRAYVKTATYLEVLGLYFLEQNEKERCYQKAESYWIKACELSEETAMIEYLSALGFFHDWAEGTDETLKKLSKALEYSAKTKDKLGVGYALDLLAYHTGWRTFATEDPDERIRLLKRGLQYAKDAKKHYSIISFTSTARGFFWAEAPYAEYYKYSAMFEANPSKKRDLLEKAVEAAPDLLERAEDSGNIEAVILANDNMGEVLFFLAMMETNSEEKKRFLEEALVHRSECIRLVKQGSPFLYWDLGIMHSLLSNVKYQLIDSTEDSDTKKTILQEAIIHQETGLKLIVKSLESFKKEAPVSQFVILGLQQYQYGKQSNLLYEFTKSRECLRKAIKAFEDAVKTFQKANLASRTAECHWGTAKVYDILGEHLKAAENFDLASNNYKNAAEKIPQFKDFYVDYASYMQAWSEIELAKHDHERKLYDKAKLHYEKSASLHKSTEHWNYLSSNYYAWARLEEAEDLSRRERAEDSRRLFQGAANQFVDAKESIHSRLEKIENEDERKLAVTLLKASDTRWEYCLGRTALEEARILDRKGNHVDSSIKYGVAADKFQEVTEALDDEFERQEITPIIELSKAWQMMTKAEAEASPDIYLEASQLFEKAKEYTIDEKAKKLALSHSIFCKALEAGTRFEKTRNMETYSKAKQHLRAAQNYYVKAGFKKASEYARATHTLLDAYMYMYKAETEIKPKKKSQYYHMADKLLQTSAASYAKAKHLEKTEQVKRLLDNIKEEQKLVTSLSEILHTPFNASSTKSFVTPSQTREKPVGLERFEDADIQARIAVSDEIKINEDFDFRIDLVNAGRNTGLLVRIDDLFPEGFEVTELPPKYSIENGSIDMKGRSLAPLKVESIKLIVQAVKAGHAKLSPQIVYVGENGKFRTCKPESITITVQPKLSFEFRIKTAQSVFDFLIGSFVEDYMRRRISLEKSGWRTLMQIIKQAKVSKSSVYGAGGRRGPAVSELERRGLVETRVFPGERGRGGRILKMRISYDKETIKRHIDQRIMKIKEK